MTRRCRRFAPRALAVAAIVCGASLIGTTSHAGGAAVLMPSEDRDLPEGSQIPDRRLQETEVKVREYKERMRRELRERQQEQSPRTAPPTPKIGVTPKT